MTFENLLCHHDNLLPDVLRTIDANAKGIAFIVDNNRVLKGVLTDGDIRRLLLSEVNMQQKAGNCIKSGFVYAKTTETNDQLLNKANERIKVIPIVDEHFRVVDYFEYKSDLHIPVASPDLGGNELKYLVDAFLSSWISSSGKYINMFEKTFSEFCDSDYGVAVSNGTVALHLAQIALNIGQGDEVIVPDLTFAATINTVLQANATPVIVDVEENSWCIDPDEIVKAITPRTKAIIPVHLYGQPSDMDKIMAIAKEYKLYVIEDCAEAHGAKYAGRKVGSFGDINCFSFYGNKVITTGEGGMCVTRSQELRDRMLLLRDHGMSKERRYYHEVQGFNYRLTNLQAAIGVAQMERIEHILGRRQQLEELYRSRLSCIKHVKMQDFNLPKRDKITWLVSVLINNNRREFYINKLKDHNIDVRNFFYSLGSMELYRPYVFSNRISKDLASRGISLPSNPSISEEIVNKIAEILAS